ncbi:hypothetical protein PMAYCL1PPCAC_08079, partial [Pristionchus mayeri]
CKIVIQIKMLEAIRHVIYLRVSNFTLADDCINIRVGVANYTPCRSEDQSDRYVEKVDKMRDYTVYSWAANLYDIRLDVPTNYEILYSSLHP